MLLVSRLPVRFTDALEIEVDPNVAGTRLTPAQALGLAERLIHQAVHRQAIERRAMAAVPKVGRVRGEAA